MDRYTNIETLILRLRKPRKTSYLEAFTFYKDISGEYNKWMKYGQEIAIPHFRSCENEFSKMNWVMGQLKIGDLYPLSLCIDTPWIVKLACQNNKCPNYNLLTCNECKDPIQSSTPTLGKLVNTINNLNPLDTIFANSRLQLKIRSIQETIFQKSGRLSIIIYDNNPPFVFDGNNRLISVAIMEGMKNLYIDCYIGIKGNKNSGQAH